MRLAVQREQTARRATEAAAARGTLDRTRHMLEALVAEAPLAIIVSNPDRSVRLWNPAAERIFGWRADEVLGRFLPTVPEDRVEDTMAHLRAALAGRVLRLSETVRRRKDGSTIDVEVWSGPLVPSGAEQGDSAGNEPAGGAGVLTIMADVTNDPSGCAGRWRS